MPVCIVSRSLLANKCTEREQKYISANAIWVWFKTGINIKFEPITDFPTGRNDKIIPSWNDTSLPATQLCVVVYFVFIIFIFALCMRHFR